MNVGRNLAGARNETINREDELSRFPFGIVPPIAGPNPDKFISARFQELFAVEIAELVFPTFVISSTIALHGDLQILLAACRVGRGGEGAREDREDRAVRPNGGPRLVHRQLLQDFVWQCGQGGAGDFPN